MRRAVVLLLAAALGACPAQARPPRRSAHTPCGDFVLMNRWDPPIEALDMLGLLPGNQALAYRLASRSRGSRSWFTFAAVWDTGGRWPRGQTVALELGDGRVLEASSVLAMSPRPECRPLLLGEVDRWLDPDQLERARSRDGLLGVVILAGFPDASLAVGEVTGVQVRQRTPTAAPAPASGGSP